MLLHVILPLTFIYFFLPMCECKKVSPLIKAIQLLQFRRGKLPGGGELQKSVGLAKRFVGSVGSIEKMRQCFLTTFLIDCLHQKLFSRMRSTTWGHVETSSQQKLFQVC